MASSNVFIQELRDKLSLSEIIGKKVNWDKKKSNYNKGSFWACCPFHDEKTASFKVDDLKGFYYCFGCHEKGDCITFIRKTENLDFFSAIKKLALEAGIRIPNNFESKQISVNGKSQKILLQLHECAVKFYTKNLIESNLENVSYFLKNRIGSQKIVSDFKLGFAPEGNKSLFNYLSKKGYDTESIISSGLCARNDKGEVFDRFRNRIIFPIINHKNEIVGLGGRALSSSAQAKYLNSPETDIFHKGKLLFNENNYTNAIKNRSQLVVVEGYMDVIALSKIGINNCVAPLGTAVTSDQLRKIWRMCNTPIFAFDGDESGERALVRLAFLSLSLISPEKTIQACRLPSGYDPDDLVSKFGEKALLTLLEKPKSLLEIIWEHETKKDSYRTPENRALLENKISYILKSITNPKLRNHFASAFNELKKKLFNMNENSFSEFFNKPFVQNYNNKGNKLRKSRRHTNHPTSSVKKSLLGSKTDPDWMEARFQETAIIISLINHPQLISKFSIQLSEINFEYKDLDIIYQSISSLNSKTKITRAEVIEKLNEMNGYDVYSKLRSTGHLQVNPFLEEFTSLKEAQLTLDDVLNRKIARQNMIQELSDAQNHIQENNDEALTWRLDQANQFLHQARSGKSIVDPYAEKTLEEDIKQIKDLIKNQIWIKKKSKKKTNH